jgi:hypothetical protein
VPATHRRAYDRPAVPFHPHVRLVLATAPGAP